MTVRTTRQSSNDLAARLASYQPLEGWLAKQGGTKFSTERRRWFVLDRRRKVLYYFKKPNLPTTSCLGVIDIMLASSITPAYDKPLQFLINIPGRSYGLTAPSDAEFMKWINGLCHFHLAEGRNRSLTAADKLHLSLLAPDDPRTRARATQAGKPDDDKSMGAQDTSVTLRDRANTRVVNPMSNRYFDAATQIEIVKQYSELLVAHVDVRNQLEQAMDLVATLQSQVEAMEQKHTETSSELAQARHELGLTKAQLAEAQESILTAKPASPQIARDVSKVRRESMAEVASIWGKERERWERERDDMRQALAKERDEWEREALKERKVWEGERIEWLDRVALLSGSLGDDEDDNDDEEEEEEHSDTTNGEGPLSVN